MNRNVQQTGLTVKVGEIVKEYLSAQSGKPEEKKASP